MAHKYPELKIGFYCGDTPQSVKREHFADVNAHWASYNVLIYTPTVSAGVSFEQKHYDVLFGYFTDQSCPVSTCVQMMGRIRDVAKKEYYICIAASGANFYTDVESIKQQAYTKRRNLYKDFGTDFFEITLDENGEIIPYESDFFHLWAENVRAKNISQKKLGLAIITEIQ